MPVEFLRTRREPVTGQVALEHLAREWLVDGVAVHLRDNATANDAEQPLEFRCVRSVRIDVRCAGPSQRREEWRGN